MPNPSEDLPIDLDALLVILSDTSITDKFEAIRRHAKSNQARDPRLPNRRQLELAKKILAATDKQLREEIETMCVKAATEASKAGLTDLRETFERRKANLDENQIQRLRQGAAHWVALSQQKN